MSINNYLVFICAGMITGLLIVNVLIPISILLALEDNLTWKNIKKIYYIFFHSPRGQ